jgi:hypothetical protein
LASKTSGLTQQHIVRKIQGLENSASHQQVPASPVVLGQTAPGHDNSVPPPVTQFDPAVLHQAACCQARIFGVGKSHEQLELQCLMAEGDQNPTKFGGLGIKTFEECQAWVALHLQQAALDFFMFQDAGFIFEMLAGGTCTAHNPTCSKQ